MLGVFVVDVVDVFGDVVFVRIGQADNGAVVVTVLSEPDVVAPPTTSCVTSVFACVYRAEGSGTKPSGSWPDVVPPVTFSSSSSIDLMAAARVVVVGFPQTAAYSTDVIG